METLSLKYEVSHDDYLCVGSYRVTQAEILIYIFVSIAVYRLILIIALYIDLFYVSSLWVNGLELNTKGSTTKLWSA